MPFVHRHLAGDQRRAVAVAVIQQLKHVAPLGGGKRCQALVVQDQQVGLGVDGHHFGEAAVAMGQAQLLHQARQAQVTQAVAVAGGLVQSMSANSGASLRGRLRVDMPTELAKAVVNPALPKLLKANPELELELSSTDRRVDLVQEGFDCVIRLGPIMDDRLIARLLGKLHMMNVASPGYLAKYGIPITPDDLLIQGHQMVHYTPTLGARLAGWEYPEGDSYASLALPGAMQMNKVQTYYTAGLAGIGLIQAGYLALAHHIKNGDFVEILPDLRPEPLSASLVVAHRRNRSQRLEAFMTWIESVLEPYFDEPREWATCDVVTCLTAAACNTHLPYTYKGNEELLGKLANTRNYLVTGIQKSCRKLVAKPEFAACLSIRSKVRPIVFSGASDQIRDALPTMLPAVRSLASMI